MSTLEQEWKEIQRRTAEGKAEIERNRKKYERRRCQLCPQNGPHRRGKVVYAGGTVGIVHVVCLEEYELTDDHLRLSVE